MVGSLVGLAWGAACGGSALAQARLALPPGAMALTRRLVRDLAVGGQIIVERDWLVRFTADAGGVAVTGYQHGVVVDAPQSLAGLAAIEQARDTNAMFPIRLSDAGLIEHAASGTGAADLDAAVERARAIIARAQLGEGEQARILRNLAQIAAVGGEILDGMPPDLFFPQHKPVQVRRQIELPDGSHGEFELDYRAFAATDGPWLGDATREVITRLGSNERHSRDAWSMRPA